MNPIDTALLTAFNKLTPKIQHDRLQASARFARTQSPVLTRPHRHACLVIRASDRRINQVAEYVNPDFGPAQHVPHEFTLFGDDIGDLNKPVFVPWPWSRR